MKGGSVGYTSYHIVIALEEMHRNPIGRPGLTRLLDLGEASVKTMLRRLRDHGLIVASDRGNTLTSSGLRLLMDVKSIIIVNPPVKGFFWGEVVVIKVPNVNPPVDIVSVYTIRDYLVMHGCRDTIIGGVSNGELIFPGLPNEFKRIISKIIDDHESSLIIVIPSKCIYKAYDAVVEYLLNQCQLGG